MVLVDTLIKVEVLVLLVDKCKLARDQLIVLDPFLLKLVLVHAQGQLVLLLYLTW